VGRVDIPGSSTAIEVDADRDLAFVSAGQTGMVIVDVATPTAPAIVATVDTPGTVLQVALDGDHAYVADWNDVRVFDVSEPGAPQLVATERIDTSDDFPRVLGIGAHDNLAYAGEWTGLYSLELRPDRRGPDLWVADRAVEFGTVAAGDADAIALIIRNEGPEPLVVSGVNTSGPFSTDTAGFTLEPGEADVLEVVFQPSDDDQATGTLTITSNDPDESGREVDLAGNRGGANPGDPAPEVSVSLLDGGEWRLADQLGSPVLLSYFATF
jgi:hypothetical protein